MMPNPLDVAYAALGNADVHTQPTDEGGNDVGRVLHVAAGTTQLMVVSVDSCSGSHAYVGLAVSY